MDCYVGNFVCGGPGHKKWLSVFGCFVECGRGSCDCLFLPVLVIAAEVSSLVVFLIYSGRQSCVSMLHLFIKWAWKCIKVLRVMSKEHSCCSVCVIMVVSFSLVRSCLIVF